MRELKQNASEVLRRVKAGATVEVTERGRLVALLVPPPADTLERLVARGVLTPGRGDLLEVEPLPADLAPDLPPASEILRRLREEER